MAIPRAFASLVASGETSVEAVPTLPPLLFVIVCLGLIGCIEPREPSSLIDHALWEDVSDSAHPYTERAPLPEDQICEELAVTQELLGAEGSITVDLDACNYIVLRQFSAVEVPEGDTVHMRLWKDRSNFSTDEPMELSVCIGDEVRWEGAFPNPGDGGLEFPEFIVENTIAEGAPIFWFVNSHAELGARHGGNSVNLIELSRNDPRWEEN